MALTMPNGLGTTMKPGVPAKPVGAVPVTKPGQKPPTQPSATPLGVTNAIPAAMPAPVTAPGTGVTLAGPGQTITSTAANAGLPSAPAPAPAPSSGAVGLTPTDPNNPLTAQTIQPGQLADRVGQAQQAWQTWVQGTDPAYQATLRQAKRVGAAVGGLGSGQLRTSIGDLGAQRTNAMDVKGQELVQNALQGQNEDVWRSLGLAERQQGFQNTQQQQAFENELRRLGFDDSLINSEFGRNLQTYMAGQAGGTGSGTALAGAGGFANQGQDALAALEALLRQRAAAPTSGTPATPTPAASIYPWMGGGVNG